MERKVNRIQWIMMISLMVFSLAALAMTAEAKEYEEKIKFASGDDEVQYVDGTRARISWPSQKVSRDVHGIGANKGLIITAHFGRRITKVELHCRWKPNKVNKKNISATHGKISWKKKKDMVVITGINASKVKFKCKSPLPQFNYVKVYVTDTKNSEKIIKQRDKHITISKAPKNFTISQKKKGTVEASWEEIYFSIKSHKEQKKVLFIQLEYAKDPEFKTVDGSKEEQRRAEHTTIKLPDAENYYFRIKYVGKDGCSKWSPILCQDGSGYTGKR